MIPSIAGAETAFDDLADMIIRAGVVANLADPLESQAGSAQVDRITGILAELDPATETGSLVARLVGVGKRARDAVSKRLATMSTGRLVAVTGTVGSLAIAASYLSDTAKRELQTAEAEDRVMADIIASLPPEERAAAYAKMTEARNASLPSWAVPMIAIVAALAIWRMSK